MMASLARQKNKRLEARLTGAQKTLLRRAAELRGESLTKFVIQAGEAAAQRVLAEAGVLNDESNDGVQDEELDTYKTLLVV